MSMIPFGVLWEREVIETGEFMLSGNLSKSTQIVVLKNSKKTDKPEDRRPDYIMYLTNSKWAEKNVDNACPTCGEGGYDNKRVKKGSRL